MNNSMHTEVHSRGNGSVLKPNHITRYIYPALLYPKHSLLLQGPFNCSQRSRPQGSGSWDTTFVTIDRASRPLLTQGQFAQYVTANKPSDHKSRNPLDRAMRRVTAWPGNTILECGKFELQGPPRTVFVIKRTTVLMLDSRSFARDEDMYEIPAHKWNRMMSERTDLNTHDYWWVRLNVSDDE